MLLGIWDAIIFEISKVLASLIDELEYRSAKRARVAAKKRRSSNPKTRSHNPIPSSYEFHSNLIQSGLGENDKAFEWLEKAYADHSTEMIYFKVDRCSLLYAQTLATKDC